MINEVFEFQRKVLKVLKPKIGEMTAAEYKFLNDAILEEHYEFDEAVKAGNVIDQVDALFDLAYFAIGGIYKLGLTPEQAQACFEHIHKTNMTKEIGTKKGREGTAPGLDAVLTSSSHDALSQVLKQIIVDGGKDGSES